MLAPWDKVSDRRGLTYDAIHLNPEGAALMADTIHGDPGRGKAPDEVHPPPLAAYG